MGGMAEMPPGGPSLTGRGTAPFEQPMRGGEIYLRSKHPLRRWSSNFSVHTVAWEPCSTRVRDHIHREVDSAHLQWGPGAPISHERPSDRHTRRDTALGFETLKPKCPTLTENRRERVEVGGSRWENQEQERFPEEKDGRAEGAAVTKTT